MSPKRRLTKLGRSDNEFMTVTCTPDRTAVEFFEIIEDADDAALVNLHPTTTVYVGQVLKQGQHPVRGTSKHIAIVVEVDPELASAIAKHNGARGRRRLASFFEALLDADLEHIRSEYQAAQRRLTEDATERIHRIIATAAADIERREGDE